jgi:hypothetical protein
MFDSGYDRIGLSVDLAEVRAQILMRIRSDRVFYAAPPPSAAGQPGRPRRHGRAFRSADPKTWPAPDATFVTEGSPYGRVEVPAWSGLHPRAPRPFQEAEPLGRHQDATDRRQDRHQGERRAPAQVDQRRWSAQDAVAVVVRSGQSRPVGVLARLPPPLRY